MIGNNIPVIADWDEPPFIKHLGLVQNTLASSLTWWLRRRAVLHIACTKPLQEYLQQRWGMQPRYPVAPPPPVMPTPYYMPSGPACTPGVCPPGPPAQPLPPSSPSPLCPTSGFNESPLRW